MVARRALRLLVIVGAFGVLLMHGADASAAATHEMGSAVAHQHHHDDRTSDGDPVHWHHVALACLAILTTAVGVGARRRTTRIASDIAATSRSSSFGWLPILLPLDTGPPRWLDLAVIRR